MQVEVTTDNHITGSEALSARVKSVVEEALGRFGSRVTWIEVHLGDENSHKAGGIWCGVNARLAGLETFNVSGTGGDVDQAVDDATAKLVKVIDRTIGKKEDHKKYPPMNGEPGL
jgi:ribosome-associated translation inhibitor RaiA